MIGRSVLKVLQLGCNGEGIGWDRWRGVPRFEEREGKYFFFLCDRETKPSRRLIEPQEATVPCLMSSSVLSDKYYWEQLRNLQSEIVRAWRCGGYPPHRLLEDTAF
jgi:hypothetical protein